MTSYSHIVTLSLLPGFFVLFLWGRNEDVGDEMVHANSLAGITFDTCYSEGRCREQLRGECPDSVEES